LQLHRNGAADLPAEDLMLLGVAGEHFSDVTMLAFDRFVGSQGSVGISMPCIMSTPITVEPAL
jgi:hypothetical protein